MNNLDVGVRALLKFDGRSYYSKSLNVEEFKILEYSPSGNWVKLQSIYGNKFWKPVSDISLVEVLKFIERPPCNP